MSWRMKLVFIIWISLLVITFGGLSVYASKPGDAAHPPLAWPSDSTLPHLANRAELLLFMHPQCSCSRATISELERLLPALKDRVHISVIFFRPEGQSEAWLKSSLWDRVQKLPHVTVIEDKEGLEARRFDVKTSGQVILFDQNESLRFAGGITPARGHEGESEGSRTLRAWAQGSGEKFGSSFVHRTAAFGCAFSGAFKNLTGVFL